MSLPTKDDFNVYGDPDEAIAGEHFYNKTLTEAEALFRENSMTYCQDFMWMGARAFNFYLDSILNYLQSDESAGDNDIVNCLHSVMEYRLRAKGFLADIPRIRVLIDYVIKNYDKFEVDHTIYGDLLATYKTFQKKLDEGSGNNLKEG